MHYSEESSQAFRSFSHYIKKGSHKQCTKSKLFDFHIIELGLSVSWWCGGLQKHLYSPDCLWSDPVSIIKTIRKREVVQTSYIFWKQWIFVVFKFLGKWFTAQLLFHSHCIPLSLEDCWLVMLSASFHYRKSTNKLIFKLQVLSF